MTKGISIQYSKAELAWIKQHCKWPHRKAHQAFCTKFNRGDVSVINYKSLCGRNGWLNGLSGLYEKGQVPYNKGKKMPYNANTVKHQFKKGHKPANTTALGTERITKDGYIEIHVAEPNPYTGADTHYVLKHKYLWEKENGKLLEEMCLKCLDSNRQNTDPSNWEIMPRGVLPYLNCHRSYDYEKMPAEVKPAVLTIAKLKHASANASKKITKGY